MIYVNLKKSQCTFKSCVEIKVGGTDQFTSNYSILSRRATFPGTSQTGFGQIVGEEIMTNIVLF